jgi:hypothetical protein
MQPILRLAGTVLLGSLLMACSSPTGSPSPFPALSPTPAATSPVVASPPAASTPSTDSPTPGATTSPTVSDEPMWQLIGQLDGQAGGITGFAGGYVASASSEAGPLVWFSPEGREWQANVLGQEFTPCPGWTTRPDSNPGDLVTNGRELLLLGEEYDPENWVCGEDGREAWRPVVWRSTDGLTWSRQTMRLTDRASHVAAVWPVADGWLAAIAENDDTPEPGETVIVRSTDGVDWQIQSRLGNRIGPYDSAGPLIAAAAAPDGTSMLVLTEIVDDPASPDGESAVVTVRASSDGATWTKVDAPFGGRHATGYDERPFVNHLLPPDGDGSPWLVVVQTEGGPGARIWTTTDFVDWHSVEFPRPTVDFVQAVEVGFIAQGRVECHMTGGACPPPRQRLFISSDGLDWQPIQPRLTGDLSVTDGPAGLLLLGHSSGRVWLLAR